jgi:potassium-transporting ATPase KdpC subunit
MFARYVEQFKPACLMFLWLTVLTGVAYPALVTGLGAGLFPTQAKGSLITKDGVVIGSALIGQPFAAPGYFTGRPSATNPVPYNAAASAGSNLAASNPALREGVAQQAGALRDGRQDSAVPMDLVTASGSGLDPHISPAAAAWQIERVAAARGLPTGTVATLVARHTEERLWGFWGERRVSVLGLNLALDASPRPQ